MNKINNLKITNKQTGLSQQQKLQPRLGCNINLEKISQKM